MPSKKILTSAIALGAAAALTLGGTFAWQSINQTALNEASDIVNPGGRLHVDMNYNGAMNTNSDIYVENFTDPDNGGQDIFARIRLEEYMEIVMNYDDEDLETVEVVAGSKTPVDGSKLTADQATRQDEFEYTYAIHYFGLSDEEKVAGTANNKAYTYWELNPGETDSHEGLYFMPTFNLNKDSLVADINGTYYDTLGGISNRGVSQYDYTEWGENQTSTATEIYDGDVDTNDELQDHAIVNDLIENGEKSEYAPTYKDDIVLVEGETHTAKQVGETKGLISMADWIKLYQADGDIADYWVYDTDGWVYWSSPIEPGECTGLLLDSFDLLEVMDDTWYYAINVVGQFVTADDTGVEDSTGFYQNGEEPSPQAQKLLRAIGATESEIVLVYNEEQLHSAVELGGYVALMEDIVLTNRVTTRTTLTIDLNGKTLSRHSDAGADARDSVILFSSGNLTLTGSGRVEGTGKYMNAVITYGDTLTINGDATYTAPAFAVHVRGGTKATINGGFFSAGTTYTDPEVCVKSSSASAYVTGGYFKSANSMTRGNASHDTSKEIVSVDIGGTTWYTLQPKQDVSE